MTAKRWQRRLLTLVSQRVGLRDAGLLTDCGVTVFMRERMAQLNLRDEEQVVDLLATSEEEWPAFLHSLVNGQTCFFRDVRQLEVSAAFLAERQRRTSRVQLVWSAGCSTGEEPYSLAILCARAGVDVDVWGTDIDAFALNTARRARYGPWTLRRMKGDVADAFEERDGQQQLTPAITAKVHFAQHNVLLDEPLNSAPGGWDLILCRNLLIYYGAEHAEVIVRQLASALRPDGLLALGASESLVGATAGITAERLEDRIFYRRKEKDDTVARQRRDDTSDEAPARSRAALSAPTSFLVVEPQVTALLEGRRYQEAASVLEAVLEENPADVSALLALGHIWLHAHVFDRAIDAYVRAQGQDPLLAEPRLFEGVAQRKRGDFAKVQLSLQRVLFLEPSCWPASYLLSGTLERLGRHDDARREAARALRLLEEGGAGHLRASSLRLGESLLPDASEALAHLRGRPDGG